MSLQRNVHRSASGGGEPVKLVSQNLDRLMSPVAQEAAALGNIGKISLF